MMKDKTIALESALLMGRSKLADYFELTKFRLLLLVLVSTSLGYYLAAPQGGNLIVLFSTFFGVACVGGGANSLNQWYERDIDTLMDRTRNRPIPTGRLKSHEAFIFGVVISVLGFIFLEYTVNSLTAFLGFASWASYLFIYTPLKKVTILNTWVGAVPGAFPALMGWTASAGALNWEALSVFSILYFWQMPHFFAISWIYREDYIKGGFKMLSWNDPNGRRTSYQMAINASLLLFASISLFFTGQSGLVYLISSMGLGLLFLITIIIFINQKTIVSAHRVFRASIIYLPLLWMMLIIDRMLI